MNLNGKVCIITGSASGIGEKCALKFAEYGADLLLIDRDEKVKSISDLIEEKYKKSIKFIVGDITNNEILDRMESIINNQFNRVDVLFNNAGVIRLSDDISTGSIPNDSQEFINAEKEAKEK